MVGEKQILDTLDKIANVLEDIKRSEDEIVEIVAEIRKFVHR